jgi:hypothetical protein
MAEAADCRVQSQFGGRDPGRRRAGRAARRRTVMLAAWAAGVRRAVGYVTPIALGLIPTSILVPAVLVAVRIGTTTGGVLPAQET